LGSQLWGLDFHTRGFQDRNLKTFRTWFSGCGISILGPGFHTRGFTVAFGHRHPLVTIITLSELLLFPFEYIMLMTQVNINISSTKCVQLILTSFILK
jgi:hypothetical protein